MTGPETHTLDAPGAVSGRWGQLNLLGERHRVHKRFYRQIAAAGREADRYSRTAGI